MKQSIKDRDIIAGCKADNPKSQRQLYDKYCRLVMGTALRYCSNATDAEDIVQEVFVKVFMKIRELKDDKALASWIQSITTRSCIDFLRGNNKNLMTVPYEDMKTEITDSSCNYYEDIPVEQLLKFVQELPDGCRTVFNLSAIDGYKAQEIADMLGCAASTVRAQYSKARKQLIEKINQYE